MRIIILVVLTIVPRRMAIGSNPNGVNIRSKSAKETKALLASSILSGEERVYTAKDTRDTRKEFISQLMLLPACKSSIFFRDSNSLSLMPLNRPSK